jgi:hypothetical protein
MIVLVAAVAATMVAALLPGIALLGATRATRSIPTLLVPAAAVCASVLVTSVALVLAMALHWSILRMLLLLGSLVVALVVVALLRWRPSRGERRTFVARVRDALPYLPPSALLVALGLADAAHVRSDTFWHVALARKVAELPELSSAALAFEAGAPGNANYPLPTWHAILAVADRAPQVDPWSAAWFVTLWLAPVAMLAFGAMAAELVGDRRASVVGCWTFVAVVVLGYGPYFYATRFLSYPGQVAIFVVLPLVAVAVVRAIARDGESRWQQLAVAAVGTVVIGILHGNYVLYPSLLAGGGAALLLLGGRDRWRGGLLAFAAVTFAGLATLAAQLPWIRADDNFLRGGDAPAGEPSAFIRHRDVFVGSEGWFHVELGSLAAQPWLVLGALAIPVLLFARRRRSGPWVLGGFAVAIVAFAAFPPVIDLIDRLGSVTPATRFDRVYPAAIGVTAIALAIGWLLDRAWRRSSGVGAAATAATCAALVAGTAGLDAIRDTKRDVVTPFVEARWVGGLDPTLVPRWTVILVTVAIVGVAAWILVRHRIRELDVTERDLPRRRRHLLAVTVVVAIVVGLAPATLDRVRSTWQPDAFRRTARTDSTYTKIDVYPAPSRRAIEAIEQGDTVLAGFNDVRRIASLVPVHSVEESVLRELMADPPSPAEAPARLDELVEEWDVDVVAGNRFDTAFQPLLDAAAADPTRFEDRSAGTLRVFDVHAARR